MNKETEVQRGVITWPKLFSWELGSKNWKLSSATLLPSPLYHTGSMLFLKYARNFLPQGLCTGCSLSIETLFL